MPGVGCTVIAWPIAAPVSSGAPASRAHRCARSALRSVKSCPGTGSSDPVVVEQGGDVELLAVEPGAVQRGQAASEHPGAVGVADHTGGLLAAGLFRGPGQRAVGRAEVGDADCAAASGVRPGARRMRPAM